MVHSQLFVLETYGLSELMWGFKMAKLKHYTPLKNMTAKSRLEYYQPA